MRVRLAFAVAAFLEPDILVIDEVLAVGDAEFQKKAIGKMQDISKGEGRTVLFVSHNMAAVKSLCTRAIVLEHGRTVFEGETDAAIGFYLSNRSKDFYFNSKNRKASDDGVLITDVKMLNKEDQVIDTILSGDMLVVEFEILKGNYYRPIHVGLGFYNNEDEPKFHCSTEVVNMPYHSNSNQFKARLVIEKWPLIEGSFYINVYLRDGSKLLDYITECLWINCEKGDYYNTGILPSWNQGFYCNYEWK